MIDRNLLAEAKAGDSDAQRSVADLYSQGRGVKKNLSEAAAWFRRAADQGNAEAQYRLGIAYAQGLGVLKNSRIARAWYAKSDEQLGEAEEDFEKKAKWYRRAAKQGDFLAQFDLAHAYAQGLGVPKSRAQAARWFRRSADQGNAPTQFNVGYFFEYGIGVREDCKEAAAWYLKAAQQGYQFAQSALGSLYENGQGVRKSYEHAYFWLRLAASKMKGNARRLAARELEMFAAHLTPASLSKAKKRVKQWRPQVLE
jgi:TPR repeat protein